MTGSHKSDVRHQRSEDRRANEKLKSNGSHARSLHSLEPTEVAEKNFTVLNAHSKYPQGGYPDDMTSGLVGIIK